MGVNGEALQLHAVYKKLYNSHENPYQYYKPCENSYQVLQVTCAAFEHAMKSYDKIIITIVQSYTGKNITCLLHTHNNTNGNKLVIFSGMTLYYGDTYIFP